MTIVYSLTTELGLSDIKSLLLVCGIPFTTLTST